MLHLHLKGHSMVDLHPVKTVICNEELTKLQLLCMQCKLMCALTSPLWDRTIDLPVQLRP